MDIVFSAVMLLVAAPVICVAAVLILLRMGRPVFFTQVRPGLQGRPFRLFKLRTMSFARSELPDAERLTSFGVTLRNYSIDELPQLWNVLRGDMSLVGPRPLLMDYLPLYSPRQWRRHEVRPGLTGWAQINGRNTLSWEDKFELDVWYVENGSLSLDLRILAATVWGVLRSNGISQPGHATAEKFRGNSS
jgi:sugar transferase EpsL